MEIMFESERLLLRKFTIDDALLLIDLNKNPEVTKYLHEPPTTELNAVDIIQNIILPQYQQNNFGRWAVHTKSDKAFIGWCGLKQTPNHLFPDVGYRLFQKYWGNGYATEAAKRTIEFGFHALQLPGIFAAAHIENIASQKVLEKCGMTFDSYKTIDKIPVKTYLLLATEFSNL